MSRTNEFAETPPGSGPSAGGKDRPSTKANTVFLSVLEPVTTLPAAHIPTAICVRAARGAARARHQFSFSLPLRNSYLRTALAGACNSERPRNANTERRRTHRSHANDDVGEQAGSRELAQLRRRLRAHQPEPSAGGLGTKQEPPATTRCSVGYKGAAIGGQAKTGGTISSIQAVAAVATATNVTARSGKSNWSCAAQADPVAVASLDTEPARAREAPAVAGHTESGDESRTPRDARALRSGDPAQPD